MSSRLLVTYAAPMWLHFPLACPLYCFRAHSPPGLDVLLSPLGCQAVIGVLPPRVPHPARISAGAAGLQCLVVHKDPGAPILKAPTATSPLRRLGLWAGLSTSLQRSSGVAVGAHLIIGGSCRDGRPPSRSGHQKVAVVLDKVVVCDGSHQSGPHSDLACADTAPNITDATREDGLPIGSLTPQRELKVVKKRLPRFHRKSDGWWSWCTKESTGDEERKPKEDAAPEDVETALRTSGPMLESRTVEIRYRNEDRWPRGAHE
ncbi:hypothetical protein NDU88_005557 [Pleurodeles waltl]|uniref:Uncharacterized protein n=1 Tax=Pleurodeles waltl TaxID=8319 RepID=A0AAV7WDQ5_PLEWA|nr:hypothetical protein NDU88_005557 [Pleurodeles waltl]